MLTQEDEIRAINLADAASRANSNGLHELAGKLRRQAEKLLGSGDSPSSSVTVTVQAEIDPSQVAFDAWASGQGLNVGQHRGGYVSGGTRERWWCWQASREVATAEK